MAVLRKLLFLLAFPASLLAQGSRYDNFVLKPLVTGGVTPVSGALITVCTSAGTGTPCTPKVANIYSDEALTTPLTGTGGAGTTNSDSFGNYGFYAAAGSYVVTITGSGITSATVKLTLPCNSISCSLVGPLLVNTTSQNALFAAEFANKSPYSYAQVRIGQPNTNTGMMLNSSSLANATISIGSVPDNSCGSGWRATDTGATDFHMGGGGLLLWEFHGDGGLVAGNCFSPTNRFVMSGNQLLFGSGSAAFPPVSSLSESPNPGSGMRFLVPGLAWSVLNGGSGVDQLHLLHNQFFPATDNVLSLGLATNRFTSVFATTFSCGTTGNITCMQSDGSNNVFIGNGNVLDMTLSAGSGRTIYLVNKLRAPLLIADQGSACTNGELALSAGWQSTGSATVTAVAGNGQTCSWTVTTGTTTAANPTITDTLTNALPAATTVCWMNIYGGTHTAVAGESLRQTTLSATVPVFTANFTPTAGGTTYFVTRSCGP